MTQARVRYLYMDVLRFVASAMVIANHVLSHYFGAFQTRGVTWTTMIVLRMPTIIAVPLFFMLSGALMLKPVASYGKYLAQRLRRIYVPFLCWSFLHYLLVMVLLNKQAFSVLGFGVALLGGDVCQQYWYLYALLPLYMLFPLLGGWWRQLAAAEQRRAILVLLLFGSLLPYANLFWKAAGQPALCYYNFGDLGVYLAYALMGHYLHTHAIASRAVRWLNALALASLLIIVVSTYVASGNATDFTYAKVTNPAVVLIAAAVFADVKALCNRFPPRREKLWQQLGALSFTAYLTHMILLRLMQTFWSKAYVGSVSTPVAALIQLSEFLLCLVGSYMVAYAAHKTPGLKQAL